MGLEKLSSNVWSHYLKIYVWLEGRALYRLRFIPTAKGFLDKYGFICCTTTCQSFSNPKTTGLQE